MISFAKVQRELDLTIILISRWATLTALSCPLKLPFGLGLAIGLAPSLLFSLFSNRRKLRIAIMLQNRNTRLRLCLHGHVNNPMSRHLDITLGR